MAKLVADYGSESDSEESDSAESAQLTNKTGNEILLPKPGFDDSTKQRSVLVNPFVEADNTKKAILEKHVKMISVNTRTINGKEICWNYRKNKCRFGHNCKFAHDSDLQIDKSKIIPSETNVKQIDVRKFELNEEPVNVVKTKKRPGLSQEIVPSKKVMKHYTAQKDN